MTFPFASSTYVDPELVTSANLYSRILAVLNTYVGGFLYGESEGQSTDTVTMAATATNYLVPATAVTFTLSQQRRVRIVGAARMQSGTVVGNYTARVAYVSGGTATLTGATILGVDGANQVTTPGTGSGSAMKADAEHSAVIAAGTWTAFVVGRRATGGSATDLAALGYCAVYDAGAS
jgi:hypothetical protein